LCELSNLLNVARPLRFQHLLQVSRIIKIHK